MRDAIVVGDCSRGFEVVFCHAVAVATEMIGAGV